MSPFVIVVDIGLIGPGRIGPERKANASNGPPMALVRRSIQESCMLGRQEPCGKANATCLRAQQKCHGIALGTAIRRRKSRLDQLVKFLRPCPDLMFRSVAVNPVGRGADRNAQCLTSINAGFAASP
jgi:hypothetical protein